MINWDEVDNKVKIFSYEGRRCEGKVVSVYDGDTVKIVFPLTDKEPERLYRWNCRLINVDTPELRTKNLREKAFGKQVRDALKEKILNKVVTVSCFNKNSSRPGRGCLLCRLTSSRLRVLTTTSCWGRLRPPSIV